jgi:hypothetical protein
MNIRSWPEDWQDELTTLLEHALLYKGTARRRLELLNGLHTARYEKKPWAELVFAEFNDIGADKLLKNHEDRTKKVAFVDLDGRLLNKPAVVGVAKKTSDGIENQRAIIYAWTFDDLRQLRMDRAKQARAAHDTIALIDKLLELQIMCPEATTPQDAADHLGININDWLKDTG